MAERVRFRLDNNELMLDMACEEYGLVLSRLTIVITSQKFDGHPVRISPF
jgi:hypothetical protein